MSEPKYPFRSFDALPLFATDREVAIAIVGKGRADNWLRATLPALERKGFPGKDPAHDGRPVPLVRRFYEAYFGITAGIAMAKPDGEERAWQPKKQRKAADTLAKKDRQDIVER